MINSTAIEQDIQLIERALRATRDTRSFAAGSGIRHQAAGVFRSAFGSAEAVIVADGNTWEAAGRDVEASLAREGVPRQRAFVFGPHVYANYACVEELEAALRPLAAIPVAVGSGTINDLTKLVAHHLNRPYMVVGTAASMDGYASFGASILKDDSKRTFYCPAPRAILADLEVSAGAPVGMNASGYADLLAKVVAGADWILADAGGIEPIHAGAWEAVQGSLRSWVGSPDAIVRNDLTALRHLTHGLVMSGVAMQTVLSSRPASGAEHQFAHLWDMQHHTFRGEAPSHGFKVGIGTLASMALYEDLFRREFSREDVEAAVRAWPSFEAHQARILELFGPGGMANRGYEETRAKYASGEELRVQLRRIVENWPELRRRLAAQLIPFHDLREMLRRAGCPFDPGQIGITRARLRTAYGQCCYMRRRYNVLDFAQRIGVLDAAVDNLFGPAGVWPLEGDILG
jgi:glycerol-1-phosphate dehydrogenase [NAD(P)+]